MMVDSPVLKKLRNALHAQTLLYVEENEGFRTQAVQLFQAIFDTVLIASEGAEALALFEKHHPPLVITEIKTASIDGIAMLKEMLEHAPQTTLIILSSCNEPEQLHEAIRLGVFDYIAKPTTPQNIISVLVRYAVKFRAQMQEQLFNTYLQNIFNYQKNLLLLLYRETVVMANQPCLEFFGASNVESFQKQFADFGDLLLEHNGFLYNHEGMEWLRETKNNPGKLYNVKIADVSDISHHFILNLQTIPEKEGYYILSLNDVTELNLLKLFDPNAAEREMLQKDQKTIQNLLEMAKRNNAKIKIHNLYKGLSITNDGIIEEVGKNHFSIKTSLMQLKAIQYEKRLVLVSDIFPMFIESTSIQQIYFDEQRVVVGTCRMAETSPTRRQYIRVAPNPEARVTLLYEGRKFDTEIHIADISIKAVRLVMATLPSGMEIGSSVILDMVLGPSTRSFIINTEAKLYRVHEQSHMFEAVFRYDLHGQANRNLIDFVAKEQMNLIREFKGMQNG